MKFPFLKIFKLSVAKSCSALALLGTGLFSCVYAAANSSVHTEQVAEPRLQSYEWMSLADWYRKHAEDIDVAEKGEAELIFLGDSITESWTWNNQNQALFDRYFGEYQSANFAIGGDISTNLIWRMEHGLKGKLNPRLIVSMVGVNDLLSARRTPEQVCGSIAKILSVSRQSYPQAYVLLEAILPAGAAAHDPKRALITEANECIKSLADDQSVFFQDLGGVFLSSDGSIPQHLMEDFLHPSSEGLKIMGQKLGQKVKAVMERYRIDHQGEENSQIFFANDQAIKITGRYHQQANGAIVFGYPGVSVEFDVLASDLSFLASSSQGQNKIEVYVDGQSVVNTQLPKTPAWIKIFQHDTAQKHHIKIMHHSESWHGFAQISRFKAQRGQLKTFDKSSSRKILILGDSITCGDSANQPLGGAACEKNLGWWDAEMAYGLKLGQALQAEVHLVCYGGRGVTRSWDGNTEQLKGIDLLDLSLASKDEPQTWDHQNFQADAIVINLGTNDFSESAGVVPEKTNFVQKYLALVSKVEKYYPDAQIFITDGPMVSDGAGNGKQKTILREYLRAVEKGHKGKNLHLAFVQKWSASYCDAHPDRIGHDQLVKDLLPSIKREMRW